MAVYEIYSNDDLADTASATICGPIAVGSALYQVMFINGVSAGAAVGMFKSTNGGQTWSQMDASNRPNVRGDGPYSALLEGSVIHCVVPKDAAPSVLLVIDFDTSTDTWGSPSADGPTLVSLLGPTTGTVIRFAADIADDGTIWVIYNSTKSGTANRTSLVSFSGGSWSGSTAMADQTGANHYAACNIVVSGSRLSTLVLVSPTTTPNSSTAITLRQEVYNTSAAQLSSTNLTTAFWNAGVLTIDLTELATIPSHIAYGSTWAVAWESVYSPGVNQVEVATAAQADTPSWSTIATITANRPTTLTPDGSEVTFPRDLALVYGGTHGVVAGGRLLNSPYTEAGLYSQQSGTSDLWLYWTDGGVYPTENFNIRRQNVGGGGSQEVAFTLQDVYFPAWVNALPLSASINRVIFGRSSETQISGNSIYLS